MSNFDPVIPFTTSPVASALRRHWFLRVVGACQDALAAWQAHQRRALENGLRGD